MAVQPTYGLKATALLQKCCYLIKANRPFINLDPQHFINLVLLLFFLFLFINTKSKFDLLLGTVDVGDYDQ